MKNVILLAEDSVDDEFLFKHVLKASGVENQVQVVQDGTQVIAYLKGEGAYADRQVYPQPDVLFLDLVMPRADGWQVLKWLQTQTGFGKILVFVLTGSAQRSRLQDAYTLGANSFIFKPFNKAELQGLIQHWPECWLLAQANQQNPRNPADGRSTP